MHNYLVRYVDQNGQGMTSMQAPYSIDAEQAAQALTEQLIDNGMNPDWVHIDQFTEITNPFTWMQAELGRRGII